MAVINRHSSLLEVAAIVSDALERAGITATLSGGSAVSIYSDNQYQSEDLDFVTPSMMAELTPVLEALGFQHSGTSRLAQYTHPAVEWYLEFPPSPLSFGRLYVEPHECKVIHTKAGDLRIITATHSVMDRLAAAISWNDAQSREQAILVAANNEVNWVALEKWFKAEGEPQEAFDLFRQSAERKAN